MIARSKSSCSYKDEPDVVELEAYGYTWLIFVDRVHGTTIIHKCKPPHWRRINDWNKTCNKCGKSNNEAPEELIILAKLIDK
jgi:hypothetical protein